MHCKRVHSPHLHPQVEWSSASCHSLRTAEPALRIPRLPTACYMSQPDEHGRGSMYFLRCSPEPTIEDTNEYLQSQYADSLILPKKIRSYCDQTAMPDFSRPKSSILFQRHRIPPRLSRPDGSPPPLQICGGVINPPGSSEARYHLARNLFDQVVCIGTEEGTVHNIYRL